MENPEYISNLLPHHALKGEGWSVVWKVSGQSTGACRGYGAGSLPSERLGIEHNSHKFHLHKIPGLLKTKQKSL